MSVKDTTVEYKVMDMLNMEGVADGSIDFVIDKGSLDALCSDSSPETLQKVKQYFNEVQRVLADDGTYFAVSLLQDFVLGAVTDFFSSGKDNKYREDFALDFRIRRIEKAEVDQYVPFLITIKKTKIDKANAKMVELRQKLSEAITFSESRMIKAIVLTVD